MNKRQKIIISIAGITIVLLALLGITYAYYLTRIEGNTNTNSISVTTADLKLVYSDGNEIVTQTNIMPGTTIGEKTFSVSNTGNSTIKNYKVVLEYVVIEGVVPSVFERPGDFEITLTCVSKNIETEEVSGTCNGYSGTWNNESFEMTLNDIDEGIKHEYSLTIFYANPDVDQSDDMGKNLNLKVQIYGENETSTITGTIDNVDETYAMKLNSNPKISTIKNVGTKENPKYQYKFIGVEHNKDGENHTLTLVNKSNVKQSEGNITINKGTNANISGSTITVKDNQTNIYLTTSNGNSLSNTATFNPFGDNTNSLAYHILNNSINRRNGTLLVDTPPSKVAKQTRLDNWDLGIEENPYYYDDENVVVYAESPDIIWSCIYEEENCDVISEYTSCTDDVKGKYIFDSNYFDTQYVSDCENGNIVIILKYEKVLSIAQDDYGTSYYYRGKVEDNYVTFNNMCWRIVRIEGDGSIKLTLESQSICSEDMEYNFSIGTANWGYKNENSKYIGDYKNSTTGMKNLLNNWFDTNFKSNGNLTNAGKKIKDEEWCLGNTTNTYAYDSPYGILGTTASQNYTLGTNFWYETGRNLYGKNITPNATLKCTGEKDISKIGTLTADEEVFLGRKAGIFNLNYCLQNENYNWWTLSHSNFGENLDKAFVAVCDEFIVESNVPAVNNVRPAVTLKPGILISSGEGTLEKPYVIES